MQLKENHEMFVPWNKALFMTKRSIARIVLLLSQCSVLYCPIGWKLWWDLSHKGVIIAHASTSNQITIPWAGLIFGLGAWLSSRMTCGLLYDQRSKSDNEVWESCNENLSGERCHFDHNHLIHWSQDSLSYWWRWKRDRGRVAAEHCTCSWWTI